MRTKILTLALLAGTVAGCAATPPPPMQMASAPPPAPMPAPAPMAMGPYDGVYRGTPELAADAPRGCARMTKPVTVRVGRNNTFNAMGMRGMISPEGNIMASGRNKSGLSGNASNGNLMLTSTKGRCTYMTTLTKA